MMSGSCDSPHAIFEAMLVMGGVKNAQVSGDRDRFAVKIGEEIIVFSSKQPHAFEQLATVLEAQIAYQRAMAMVAAAGEMGAPLWLVAGSDMLGKWLAWSRIDRPLAKVLSLTDRADAAPVIGRLARRSRRELGQMSAKIRVSGGQAVAERIELSHQVPIIATLGDRAVIRVQHHHLPETVLSAMLESPGSNGRWRASEIVSHPFFETHDFIVAHVANDGHEVVIELETTWAPLAPIPKAALTAVPCGANPAFPWRATNREVAELYGLASRGERAMKGGYL